MLSESTRLTSSSLSLFVGLGAIDESDRERCISYWWRKIASMFLSKNDAKYWKELGNIVGNEKLAAELEVCCG
jgi:hypothetical protein